MNKTDKTERRFGKWKFLIKVEKKSLFDPACMWDLKNEKIIFGKKD